MAVVPRVLSPGAQPATGTSRDPPEDPGTGLGRGGVPDAELAGRVVEAGLPREREEPVDVLFGVRAGEGVPDGRRERAGSAEGVGVAVHAVPGGDAGVAGCDGEGLDRDAGFGGDGGRCGNRQPSCFVLPVLWRAAR